MAGLLDEPYIGYPQLRRRSEQSLLGGTPRGLLNTTPSADTLRKLGEQLINIPTSATRAITDPQLFARLLGITPNQQLSGFSAGYAGLPAKPPSDIGVVDPRNIDYSKGYSSGEEMGMMTALAAPLAPLARPVGRAVGEQAYRMTEDMLQRQGLMPSITAYHGTPYNIKGGFDISKVGTGEGAQAYGRGMYFAENPSVAKEYAMTVPKSINNDAYNAENIANRLFKGGYDEEYITNRIKSVLPNADDKVILNALDNVKKGNIGGNVYKVDIPDEYLPNMINSDNQLKDQPESIKKFVKKNIKELTEDMYQYKPQSQNDKVWDRLRGIDLIMWANEKYGYENAAKFLNSEGIKGVKYLDQGSRSAGKGTSNFVVFDPTDVKILEKNSQKVESLLD
jgi:hypothetical protein